MFGWHFGWLDGFHLCCLDGFVGGHDCWRHSWYLCLGAPQQIDFPYSDLEIGQILTEGGYFYDVADYLMYFCVCARA
jgi:hypothetical protein